MGVQRALAAVDQFLVLFCCVGMAEPMEGHRAVRIHVPYFIPVLHNEELQMVDGPVCRHVIGHQQLMTTFLGKLIDLYTVLTCHFADAMAEVDRVAEDEGLKQSLRRYAIESGAITERVYRKEMEQPIEDMKRFLDGILHIYDEGRTKVSMGDLFGIVAEAEARLSEKENSVAP